MKNKTGYALIKKTEMAVIAHYLPIFWLKKVALEEAKKFNCIVIKVRIDGKVCYITPTTRTIDTLTCMEDSL